MTSILFYVEPLIERGKPYWKDCWVAHFSRRIMDSLSAAGSEHPYQFRMMLNEPIWDRVGAVPGADVTVLNQQELMEGLGTDTLTAMLHWMRGTYTDRQLEHHVALMKEKLGTFQPDIIITWSPVPFLRKAYPEALILHYEYSLFSRHPFPETWYFDPEGVIGPAFLVKHHDEVLGNLDFGESQRRLVRDFKESVRQTMRGTCPFASLVGPFRSKHRHVVLLPLQFSQFYLFDGLCEYRSQFEYLTAVLDRVPRDVGVIVTPHPQDPFLDHETAEYIGRAYPNVLLHEEFSAYNGSSDYLAGYADAIITVSSKVGFMPLIWDNRLISLGRDFLTFSADATTLNNLETVLRREPPARDRFLYWLMTRFAVPEAYLLSPTWFSAFMEGLLTRFRDGVAPSQFYDPIDEDAEIFRFYGKVLRRAAPPRAYASREAAHQGDRVKAQEIMETQAKQLAETRADLAAIREDRAKAQSIMDSQKARIEELSAAFDALERDRAEAQRIMEAQSAEISRLGSDFENLRLDRCKAQTVIDHQVRELDRVETELKVMIERAAQQESQLASSREMTEAMRGQLGQIMNSRSWRALSQLKRLGGGFQRGRQ